MKRSYLKGVRGGVALAFFALALNCDKDDGGVRGDGDGDQVGDGDGDTSGDGDGDMPGDGDGDTPGDGDEPSGGTSGDGDGDNPSGGVSGDGDGDAGGAGGFGGEPCPDDDNDFVCNADDQCPGHDDTQDDDADTVANGCDLCADENDTIDIDENAHADCDENIITNSNFHTDIATWNVTAPATISHSDHDAQGDAMSGSVFLENSGGSNFLRGPSSTFTFSAEASSQLVSFGAEYFIPPGQEAGDVAAFLTYYATSCSGGNATRVDVTEMISTWDTISGQVHIPAGTTCVTLRLESERIAGAVNPSFDVFFDNALVHMCVDADEDFACD